MKIDLKHSQLDLLLLCVLKGGPLHGYAVIVALGERSGGFFDMAEGTVYPALHRLEQAGLVSSEWDSSTGRKRRVYTLSKRGREELVDQASEWRQWSRGLNKVLEWSR